MSEALRRDGESGIAYRCWDAAGAGTVFLLVHGLGGHAGRWDFFGRYLAQHGVCAYALELRGFGESAGMPGYIDSFAAYYDDIARLREIALREHPASRIVLAGESMGGLIVFALAASRRDICDGLVCISPAFKSILPFGPLDYGRILFSYLFNPLRYFRMPIDSRMCTRDTAYQKVMDVHAAERRLVTARLLGTIALTEWAVEMRRNHLAVPALFLIPGADRIVDARASEGVFAALDAADKTIIRYPDMYHALSIDLGRERVFDDILSWTMKRYGGAGCA